jgi:uncharacterized protein (TIGR03032 family)
MSETPDPFRSTHSKTLPALLHQLGISLVVSTYQAGKVVVLRADGDRLNTHFRLLPKPMGLAVDGTERLAIGTRNRIWLLQNVPAIAPKAEPNGKHDACFLPRQIHVTGNIDVHEMAWGNDGLWFVNTRFSCLCTLDSGYSFVPRWRPSFTQACLPGDRCHLNGLELVNGDPQYVTALGISDTPGGWRDQKATGGILIDVPSNEIIAQGLSMPHSPRWYRDRLWILESGQGSLATVDANTGHVEPVVMLPGFTRGLDFYDNYAFIGLSQVRESATFSGLPLTERLSDRICGVWVVNIETGAIVAFLTFEDAVQEVFAVQVMPGIKFPEILVDDSPLVNLSYVLPDATMEEIQAVEHRTETSSTSS